MDGIVESHDQNRESSSLFFATSRLEVFKRRGFGGTMCKGTAALKAPSGRSSVGRESWQGPDVVLLTQREPTPMRVGEIQM